MSRSIRLLMVLVLCFAAAGCSTPFVEYRPGHAVSLRAVPTTETFALYSDNGRIESTTVKVGNAIGFQRRGGQLVALDGSDELPLKEGNYAWFPESARRPWWPFQTRQETPLVMSPATGQQAAFQIGLGLLAQAVSDIRRTGGP